ncbi:hypothetical protein SK128_010092, partial [Halocaridina rubra]
QETDVVDNTGITYNPADEEPCLETLSSLCPQKASEIKAATERRELIDQGVL